MAVLQTVTKSSKEERSPWYDASTLTWTPSESHGQSTSNLHKWCYNDTSWSSHWSLVIYEWNIKLSSYLWPSARGSVSTEEHCRGRQWCVEDDGAAWEDPAGWRGVCSMTIWSRTYKNTLFISYGWQTPLLLVFDQNRDVPYSAETEYSAIWRLVSCRISNP